MNLEHESRAEDERAFDLLVDGELDDARRSELLLRLDQTPGGWRACAMAFLEAQAWQREMGAIARPSAALLETDAPKTIAPKPGKPARSAYLVNALAVAASFAIAFGLGVWYRGFDRRGEVAENGGVAHVANDAAVTPVAGDPALRRLLDEDGYMTLALGGVAEGEPQQVRVPVTEARHGYDAAAFQAPLELPRDLLAELRQEGQTVRQQRSLVPIQLGDGRSIIVPMDELEIVPVSQTFQ
jgi:hypothetical protein